MKTYYPGGRYSQIGIRKVNRVKVFEILTMLNKDFVKWVAITRAIIGSPKLLLADEPTGNLHSEQGEMIMNLLKKLNKEGMAITQVTRNEKYANYGSRVIQLEYGLVREDFPVNKMVV